MHTLNVTVTPDAFTDKVAESFDYQFTGTSIFTLPDYLRPTDPFGIGVIVGSSGSGKTQILRAHYGYTEPTVTWDPTRAIVSHFETPDLALERLFAVGLSSIPTLCRPYHVLSNGEQYRANVARLLSDGAIFDEYTSVVNRETAKSLSVALSKYIRKKNIQNVILSTCHRDIIEWLEPDWVFDCDGNIQYLNQSRTFLKRVATLEIY